jgi:hypothetical protein
VADLADADAVAVVIDWLGSHDRLTTALTALDIGEVDGADHISGIPEAPWPHVVVTEGAGGDLGDLRYWSIPEVQIEVFDDYEGSTGEAEIIRIAKIAVMAVRELTERVDVPPGEPVVPYVRATSGLFPEPAETGQNRAVVTLALTIRPGIPVSP